MGPGGHPRRGPAPEADLNGDGTITREEDRQWHQQNIGNKGGGKDRSKGKPGGQQGSGNGPDGHAQNGPPPKRK